ncbi:MAG TPA: glycerophosphodiester phosphodiesterase [Candidatus Nanoarchaeia archaeon]|nr:glycerophosphodiester phosphodiesterase [Candidatus Nanoarchaeia archaeon]
MILISHRANNPGYKENTLSAIRAVQKYSPEIIEIDIRLTKDKILVLHHDALYKKVPFRLIKKANKSKLSENIPALKEVLNEFPKQKFHLDLKENCVKELLPIIKGRESKIIVSSYNAGVLNKIKTLNPKIETKLNNCGNGIDPVKRALKIKATGIHVYYRVATSKLIKRAHKHNLLVCAWTVNSEKDLFNTINKGVDGIITDRIDKFSKIFKEDK